MINTLDDQATLDDRLKPARSFPPFQRSAVIDESVIEVSEIEEAR